jgi:hypothetical protein
VIAEASIEALLATCNGVLSQGCEPCVSPLESQEEDRLDACLGNHKTNLIEHTKWRARYVVYEYTRILRCVGSSSQPSWVRLEVLLKGAE